jgi:signal transduction histidine kinase
MRHGVKYPARKVAHAAGPGHDHVNVPRVGDPCDDIRHPARLRHHASCRDPRPFDELDCLCDGRRRFIFGFGMDRTLRSGCQLPRMNNQNQAIRGGGDGDGRPRGASDVVTTGNHQEDAVRPLRSGSAADKQQRAIDAGDELVADAVLEHGLQVGNSARTHYKEVGAEAPGGDCDGRGDVIAVGSKNRTVGSNSGSCKAPQSCIEHLPRFAADLGVQRAMAVPDVEIPHVHNPNLGTRSFSQGDCGLDGRIRRLAAIRGQDDLLQTNRGIHDHRVPPVQHPQQGRRSLFARAGRHAITPTGVDSRAMTDRRDRKDVLLEAGLALASELSLPIVLQRIVDLAAEVTDARYGALGVIAGDELVEFITTGMSAQQRRDIGALPRGRGVLGLLIKEPRPLRINNIGDHPQSVGFPPNHPPMRSFLGAPVQAMGRVFGNIYLAEKRGAQEFSAGDQESLVVLATQAGVAIANASLYEEIRLRERWLNGLRDITNDILSGADSASILVDIAERARELAKADAATIAIAGSTPDQLVVTAAVGARASELQGQPVPAVGSISGDVMRTGKPLVLEDVSADPRADQRIVQLGRHGPALFVPLRVRGRATGTLMVANLKGGRRFDQQTLQLVETFADQASVAIEYGRAQTDLRRLGLMEERERIAKELHDGIIQSVFAVGMGLQGTALLAGSPETAARIEGAVDQLDAVIRDLRNYIFGLRPGILADHLLDEALRELGNEIQKQGSIRVEVQVDAALAATVSSRSHEIVQLTREALSNVARHAQAKSAVVRLVREGQMAVLVIEDDGVGFKVRGGALGNGLRNMRERAATMGGRLQVTSRVGKGTKLRLTFPV